MTLEVLTREPAGQAHPVPVLFIHGAYSCAGLWQPFFLPYFAQQGYAAHALSLRGHGGSDGREALKQTRLKDYVADVLEVAQGLPAMPHAMMLDPEWQKVAERIVTWLAGVLPPG